MESSHTPENDSNEIPTQVNGLTCCGSPVQVRFADGADGTTVEAKSF